MNAVMVQRSTAFGFLVFTGIGFKTSCSGSWSSSSYRVSYRLRGSCRVSYRLHRGTPRWCATPVVHFAEDFGSLRLLVCVRCLSGGKSVSKLGESFYSSVDCFLAWGGNGSFGLLCFPLAYAVHVPMGGCGGGRGGVIGEVVLPTLSQLPYELREGSFGIVQLELSVEEVESESEFRLALQCTL